MRQKRILVLGGNIVQAEATMKAKSLGYHVISSDLHEDNPGHEIADEYDKVDITDKEAVLKEAIRLQADGIVPYSSDALATTAAFVAEQAGLPGNPYISVETLTHKDLFRNFLRENGFATPRSESFTNPEDARKFLNTIRGTAGAIMKPVDSAGSRGVFRVHDADDIDSHWNTSMSYSSSGRIIIEEFIEKEGPQVDGDVFVHEGRIIFAGFADQHHVEGMSELVPVSLSAPSVHPAEVKELALNELQRLFTLLNFRTGPCNVEFIVGKDGRIYFIDLGPRNGGCNIPFLEMEAYGFDEDMYTIKAAVGDEIPEWSDIYGRNDGHTYVMYYRPYAERNGIYEGLWMSDEFRKRVIKVTPLMTKGQEVRLSYNGNDSAAVVFARFERREDMQETIRNIDRHLRVTVR